VHGADWKHPLGPASDLKGKEKYPVVQVAYEDALAYAHWRGRRLPSENEWERAARGDAPAPPNLHAEAFASDGAPVANTWQGVFPVIDRGVDGFAGLAPVGCFPANAAGLYDMVGNVWEWTVDFYAAKHEADAPKACCVPTNPRGGREAESFDPGQPEIRIPRRVVKGGSHLCAPNYCLRYRPAARQGETIDTAQYRGKSVLAGGLTLAVLVLPIVIITTAEALRAVPASIREAGFGVGATHWEVIRSHVLPSAAPGILTGTVLTVARAVFSNPLPFDDPDRLVSLSERRSGRAQSSWSSIPDAPR
jgi:hypothetical protein